MAFGRRSPVDTIQIQLVGSEADEASHAEPRRRRRHICRPLAAIQFDLVLQVLSAAHPVRQPEGAGGRHGEAGAAEVLPPGDRGPKPTPGARRRPRPGPEREREREPAYSTTATGRPVFRDLGRGRNRPTAQAPGPAITVGASRPINARLYSNPPALRKNPFLP